MKFIEGPPSELPFGTKILQPGRIVHVTPDGMKSVQQWFGGNLVIEEADKDVDCIGLVPFDRLRKGDWVFRWCKHRCGPYKLRSVIYASGYYEVEYEHDESSPRGDTYEHWWEGLFVVNAYPRMRIEDGDYHFVLG